MTDFRMSDSMQRNYGVAKRMQVARLATGTGALTIGALGVIVGASKVSEKQQAAVHAEKVQLVHALESNPSYHLHRIQQGEIVEEYLRCEGFPRHWALTQTYAQQLQVAQLQAEARGDAVQRLSGPAYLVYAGKQISLPDLNGDTYVGCEEGAVTQKPKVFGPRVL